MKTFDSRERTLLLELGERYALTDTYRLIDSLCNMVEDLEGFVDLNSLFGRIDFDELNNCREVLSSLIKESGVIKVTYDKREI